MDMENGKMPADIHSKAHIIMALERKARINGQMDQVLWVRLAIMKYIWEFTRIQTEINMKAHS